MSQIITQSARPRLSFQQWFSSSICIRMKDSPCFSRRQQFARTIARAVIEDDDSIDDRFVMPEEERDHSFLVPTGRVQIDMHLGRRDGWFRGEKASHARSPRFLPAIVDLAMSHGSA
jgi:hypothetical protein